MANNLLELDDLGKLVYVCDFDVDKTGKEVLITKKKLKKYTEESKVYRMNLEDKTENSLVVNFGNFESGKFSKEGRITFISDESGVKQLYILEENEPKKLTTLTHGISSYEWSPDGKTFVFVGKIYDQEKDVFSELSHEERLEWEEERLFTPYVAEDLVYKMDEAFGMYDGGYTHIGIGDLDGNLKMITTGSTFYYKPYFSGDGKKLAFYGKPHSGYKGNHSEVFVCDLDTLEYSVVTDDKMIVDDHPAILIDDKLIYCRYDEDGVPKLFSFCQSTKVEKNLFPEREICHGVDCKIAGRTSLEKENHGWQLSHCRNYIYFTSVWDNQCHIYKLNINGEPNIEKITTGDFCVRSFKEVCENEFLFTRSEPDYMADLYSNNKGEEPLTKSNLWLEEILRVKPVKHQVQSKDKEVVVNGFVMPPTKVKNGKKYPTILYIHGGPTVSYAYDFWFEFQYLAAKGFAIVYCDPRGSAGYGQDFAKGANYGWAQEALDDLMVFLDSAIETFDFIDKEKLGATGGSYGGYMTNKIMGQLDCFKAVVTQRTFMNPVTSYGTGDIGFVSSNPNDPKTAKDLLKDRAKTALIKNIDKYTTPLLILHGTHDIRCGFEQGEQLFVVMKDRRPEIPCKLVAYPGENHGVSRTGRLNSQMSHIDEMVKWFEKYLKEENINE